MLFSKSTIYLLSIVLASLQITSARTTTASPPLCTLSHYDGLVTDTTNQRPPIIFTIQSSNPTIDGRVLQLRPDDATSKTPAGAIHKVVVDCTFTSPVLFAQLRNSTMYSVARDFSNNLYDLGPIGGLRTITYNATSKESRSEFIFRNSTVKGVDSADNNEFKKTEKGWQFLGGGDNSDYNLYRNVGDGIVNGFIACQTKDSQGAFWELEYYTYENEPSVLPQCEFIGIDAVLSPEFVGPCT